MKECVSYVEFTFVRNVKANIEGSGYNDDKLHYIIGDVCLTLNDYNNIPPFDLETEVYGGELIFKNYKTIIKPGIGNLLIFPSSPNFAHQHTPIKLGKLNFIKLYFVCKTPFIFDYTKYSTQLTL